MAQTACGIKNYNKIIKSCLQISMGVVLYTHRGKTPDIDLEATEMHIYEVVKRNGSLYLKYTFNGSNYQSEDYMKIYGIGRTPYVKRMGTKINLTAEMIEMMNEVS